VKIDNDAVFKTNNKGLINNISRIYNVDLNNYKTTGIYYASNCTNQYASYAMVMIISQSGDAAQVAFVVGNPNKHVGYRAFNGNGATWSEWIDFG
jgi:hypothetical protein